MNKKPTMNLPNILTLVRLLLVPVVITLILVSYYTKTSDTWKWTIGNDKYQLPILWLIAGVIFIIASFTDFLDGYLARKNDQVTDFGKFFDPIADKLLVNSALILLSTTGMIPVWMTLILIMRDIIVDFIRMILSKKGITLAAGIGGKLKTVFQMIGLSIIFFLNYQFLNISEFGWVNQIIVLPMYIATFFSIYSGVVYFVKAKPNLF